MDWLRHDEIKTRVSYYDGREAYETLSVNDAVTNRGFEELGGTTSSGEFGTILDSVFSYKTDCAVSLGTPFLAKRSPGVRVSSGSAEAPFQLVSDFQ